MIGNNFQYQCDFCFAVIRPEIIYKEDVGVKNFGNYMIYEMFLVRDTTANGEFHICPRCLEEKMKMQFNFMGLEKVAEDD